MTQKRSTKNLISEKSRFSWNYGAGRVDVTEIELGLKARKAYIIDGFLSKSQMKKIYSNFTLLPYRLNDSDRTDTAYAKHFACQFPKAEWEQPYIQLFETLAQGLLQHQGQKFNETIRAYANLNLFGDFQFAHNDSDVWTALVFANDEWNVDWGGELLLYGDEKNTLAYAVLPVPGRMIVFDGLIPHRGGVPSKYCLGPRISLAIKMSR